jgi:ABC-2 type transport system permease protein
MLNRWSLKKEFIYGVRNYRYLIVFAAFMFFAVVNPVMTKLVMPGLFKNYYPEMSSEMIEKMLGMTHYDSVRAYLGDTFEMGMLIIAFLFSGIMAQEISEKTFILPMCSGKRFVEMIFSKFFVNGAILIFTAVSAAFTNYFYSGIFFGFTIDSASYVLWAGLFQGIYMLYVLAWLILMGTLVRKQMITGLIVLIPAYGTMLAGNLFRIDKYLPSGLLTVGQALSPLALKDILWPLMSALILVAAVIYIALIRLRRMEIA